MKVTLYFTRQFTHGTLKGLLHNDSIPFLTAELAKNWLGGIKANVKNLNYFIVKSSFQNYAGV